MAKSDLDSMPHATVKYDTAAERLADWQESPNDTENRAAAAAAGVKDAAYINYDAALTAYGKRADVEDLAHKNARDMPARFSDADFMRATGDADASNA